MSSTRAPRVAPLPSTVLLPPVWVRRMVGIRTSMAIAGELLVQGWRGTACGDAGVRLLLGTSQRDRRFHRRCDVWPSCRGPRRAERVVGGRRVLRLFQS